MSEYRRRSADLAGFRVGLSGAVPEPETWGGRPLDWEIQEFVTALTDAVLRHGGELVHGCHPSFTLRLLEAARSYACERGRPVARLYVSEVFEASETRRAVEESPEVADLLVTPAAGEGGFEERRGPSLTRMRGALVGDMDALVVVGGKGHADTPYSAGTEEELELALARGLPCFLIGGLGGKSAELARRYGARRLDNGLSEQQNRELAATEDLHLAVGIVVAALRRRRKGNEAMDDTVKHLEMIQEVIKRMAGNSFLLKGWSVTLVAAVLALGSKDSAYGIGLIALIPALVFWGLDGYFLRQERLYRKLYDAVRPRQGAVDFSMDTRPFMQNRLSSTPSDKVGNWCVVALSPTLRWFHGAVVLSVLAICAALAVLV